MLLDEISVINEAFEAEAIKKKELDLLLQEGWRNHGKLFFRYSLAFLESELRFVIPLRIRLSDFGLSKRYKRILNQNQRLKTTLQPVEIDREKEQLFERHKARFKDNIPESLTNFLDPDDPANTPCESYEISVFGEDGKLIASSFFSEGENSISSIYAMFAPEESSRSLGIFTMLKEIQYAQDAGKSFYYQGYVYAGESFYDYKKRFAALESYDWKGNWSDFTDDFKLSFPI